MSNTLTDREKDNLIKFWEAYNARNNPLLDDPWTPDFGHYPPTLELKDPAGLVMTDEEDPAGCPGQQWQGTQTAFDIQEPPQESQEGFKAAMCRLYRNKEFCAFLGAMALFLVALAVFGN